MSCNPVAVGRRFALGRAKFRAVQLGDQEQRTLLRLQIDPADVFADHAENRELGGGRADDQQNQAGPARRYSRGYPRDQGIQTNDDEYDREQRAAIGRDSQRNNREADDPVEREAEQFSEGVLGLAAKPRLAVVKEGYLPEPEPRDHAANKAVPLRHVREDVRDTARHEAEVAGVERDVHIGGPGQQPVEQRRRSGLEGRVAAATAPLAVDDVGRRLLHQLVHRDDEFRGILKVVVDDEDEIAPDKGQTGRKGILVAVVARKLYADHVRILRSERLDALPRLIARAVVDQDDFILLGRERAAGLRSSAVKLAQSVFLIVTGNHHGQRDRARGLRQVAERRR